MITCLQETTVKTTKAILCSIQWDSRYRRVTIGQTTVKLTATQYQLLWPLRHGVCVTYTYLASFVYQCEVDERVRVMIDKHIDRIRHKLRGTGLYIYCVRDYGYLLFPQSCPSKTVPDAQSQRAFAADARLSAPPSSFAS